MAIVKPASRDFHWNNKMETLSAKKIAQNNVSSVRKVFALNVTLGSKLSMGSARWWTAVLTVIIVFQEL